MAIRRIVTWTIVLGLIGLGLYLAFRPQPVLVETANVAQQAFTVVVEEDGKTRVRDRYVVSAPLAGRIARTHLKAGDTVTAGQVLTNVTPNVSPLLDARTRQELVARIGEAEAAVEEARALQERAQVQVERAAADLARTTQLAARGIVSDAKLERDTFEHAAAQRELAAAERRRDAAEHALEQARAALRRNAGTENESFSVTAPVDGQILKVVEDSATTVALGAPLFEIGNREDLEVVVDVLTSDAATIGDGARASFERWGGEADLEGRVRRIEPAGFTKVSALGVEEQRVWVVLDITSPRESWQALGDQYRVGVRIVTREIPDAIVVPEGALFRRGESWQAFVVADGQAVLRTIEVTARSGRFAAVGAGLEPGDAVIVYPPDAVENGAPVLPQ